MSLNNLIKNYLEAIRNIGLVAFIYIGFILLLFFLLLAYDRVGYSSRIIRGSKSVIRFYRERGWVDNSNVGQFIVKCIRKYPYSVRACFSLYTSSDKHLEEYINEKHNNSRDYTVREKIVKNLYDLLLGLSSIIALLYLFASRGFLAFFLIFFIAFGLVLRNVLIGAILFREMQAKKYFLRALDLMYNGIFLPKKGAYQYKGMDAINQDDSNEETEILKYSKERKDRLNNVLNDNEKNLEKENLAKDNMDDNTDELKELAIDKTH